MKHKLILLVLLGLSSSLLGQESYTLREAIDFGLENHINIKMKSLEVEDAEQQIREYKSIGIPNVNGGVNYNYYVVTPVQPLDDFITPAVYGILFGEGVDLISTETPATESIKFSLFQRNNLSAYVEASALLFDASYLQGLKAARLFKDLTTERTNITEEEVAANIAKAYIAVLIAQENKIIIENNIQNVSKILFETEQLYKNGFAEQLDVDRLSYSKENLQNELNNLEKIILVSQNVLKFQMYYPIFDEITLTEDLKVLVDVLSIENINLSDDIDFSNRAELSVFDMAIELDEMDLERLKKSYLPSLVAQARIEESLQRNRLFNGDETGFLPTASVGLSLRIPIYDGGNRKASTQRTKIRLDKRQIEKNEFERGISLAIYNAKVSFLNAKSTLENRYKGLDLAQRIFDKTQIKFKEGVGSSIEVSQAESALYQSQGQYINALYDLVLAKTELDIAKGKIEETISK